MSEVNNPTDQGSVVGTPVVISSETPAVVGIVDNPVFNFHALVKERVLAASPSIKNSVIQSFVDKEVAKIETAIGTAITQLDVEKAELRKIKPDNTTFDENGKVVNSSYNKDTVEKLKAKREKVAKIEKAIQDALDGTDYSKVLGLSKEDKPKA
jgi:hypothetical protein